MRDNRIKQIAQANGFNTICNKTYEELGELTTALAKYQHEDNNGIKGDGRRNLVSEIADATIMIKQLVWLIDLTDEVERMTEHKLTRQCERMSIK